MRGKVWERGGGLRGEEGGDGEGKRVPGNHKMEVLSQQKKQKRDATIFLKTGSREMTLTSLRLRRAAMATLRLSRAATDNPAPEQGCHGNPAPAQGCQGGGVWVHCPV